MEKVFSWNLAQVLACVAAIIFAAAYHQQIGRWWQRLPQSTRSTVKLLGIALVFLVGGTGELDDWGSSPTIHTCTEHVWMYWVAGTMALLAILRFVYSVAFEEVTKTKVASR